MKKPTTGVLAAAAVAALAAAFVQQPAVAAPVVGAPGSHDHVKHTKHRQDDRATPFSRRQSELRQEAIAKVLAGKRKLRTQQGGGATVKLSEDVYASFPRQKDDKIFTVLSEFGDQVDATYGGQSGPVHNQIPEPDRSQDNSTIWAPNFDKAHYTEMFNGSGESMQNFFEEASSGRYSVTNTVDGWVQVPFNGTYYGSNADVDGDGVGRDDDGGAWAFIEDTGDAWYQSQLDAGKTSAEIDRYLSQFDVWDRYDYDADGDFNEPDGYIDHFQAIHAGEGEEAGAPADTIWSHRWYVNVTDAGSTGPTVDGTQNLLGGAQIGDSKYYLGDYTVEPENGGLGVFTHEFTHDLGIPDYYDTAGGDNGTGFWTLMSGGSWMSHGDENGPDEGIGATPDNMGAQEKLQLGWLDYSVVDSGERGEFTLGPAAHTYDGADQAVVVNLPKKTTTHQYVAPRSGTYEWWSQRGNNLSNTLTREVPAAGTVDVSAAAWYAIEAGYDYLYAEYSLDGGQTWEQLGTAVDGFSDAWTTLSYSYDAGGQASLVRFRYQTDGGVDEAGAFLDDITITAGGSTFTDGAEDGNQGWTAGGWKIIDGTETKVTPRYYLLENRAYVGYDDTLRTGPYNFSEGVTRPDWVEYFPYQNGMLVWYVDMAYTDNNTSQHPGAGMALPVDARPKPFRYQDGTMPGNRRQPFDATFGVERTDRVCLHKQVVLGQGQRYRTVKACAKSDAPIRTFDDSKPGRYFSTQNPLGSVRVAGVGVRATVTGEHSGFLTVKVTNP